MITGVQPCCKSFENCTDFPRERSTKKLRSGVFTADPPSPVCSPWGANFDTLGGLHTCIWPVPQESLQALGQKVRADTGRFVATHRQDIVRICPVTATNQLKLKRGTRRCKKGRCCFGIKWRGGVEMCAKCLDHHLDRGKHSIPVN